MKKVFHHPKSNFRNFIESFSKDGGVSLSIGIGLIIILIFSNLWIVINHSETNFLHLTADINKTLSKPYLFETKDISESKKDTIRLFDDKQEEISETESNSNSNNIIQGQSTSENLNHSDDNAGLITEDDNLDDFLFDENLSLEENNFDDSVESDTLVNSIDTALFRLSDNVINKSVSDETTERNNINLLGTDEIGRDLFTYLLLGFEIYFLGGLLSVVVALFFGVLLGTISVYYETKLIGKLARLVLEFLQGLPKILFLFTSVIIFGVNFLSIMITIGLVSSLKVSDMLQNRIRTISKEEFIDSAKQLGLSDFKIITKHILFYNCRDVIITSVAFVIADTILLETTMAFLNYGVQMSELFTNIDIISWGTFLEQGKRGINSGEYWLVLYPSLMILLTILASNLIGNGLKAKYHIK